MGPRTVQGQQRGSGATYRLALPVAEHVPECGRVERPKVFVRVPRVDKVALGRVVRGAGLGSGGIGVAFAEDRWDRHDDG